MSHPIQLRRRARQRAKRRRWEREHGWANSPHPRKKGARSWRLTMSIQPGWLDMARRLKRALARVPRIKVP